MAGRDRRARRAALVALLLGAGACGGEDEPVSADTFAELGEGQDTAGEGIDADGLDAGGAPLDAAAGGDAAAGATSHLCDPCLEDTDCNGAGESGGLCVKRGPGGSFCGQACGPLQTCPAGYGCYPLGPLTGQGGEQCLPLGDGGAGLGACACSEAAIAAGRWTTCERSATGPGGDVIGTCAGKRRCAAGGLGPCDAPTPEAESCDGLDNDCDGQTDEGLCDDGDPCTTDDCDPEAGCTHEALCDDGDPCTADDCDPKTGCAHQALVGDCDDGDPCTAFTTCAGGKCEGVPAGCGDGDPCTTDACDPKAGCTHEAVAGCGGCKAHGDCADALACTDDTCDVKSGKCSSKAKGCDDGDSCTADACDPKTGACASAWSDKCDEGGALPFATAFNCASLSSGLWTLQPAAAGGPGWAVDATPSVPGASSPKCSLNFNNGKDYACPAGAASVSGTATSPWIDGSKLGPKSRPRMGFKWAGSWEKGNDDELWVEVSKDGVQWIKVMDLPPPPKPSLWGGTSASLYAVRGSKFKVRFRFFTVDCVDNTGAGPFVDDLLIRDTACYAAADCTHPSKCLVGACIHNTCVYAGKCDDGQSCTNDGCSASTGACTHAPKADGAPCDDADTCTVGDACKAGKCAGSAGGKEGQPCTDGKACTVMDVCKQGACAGTMACDDANPCTDDACHPLLGKCVHDAAGGKCDDGDPCTSGDACLKGSCGGVPKPCDDGDACTTDKCKGPKASCAHEGGLCDDGDSCTADACDPTTGTCAHLPAAGCGASAPLPYAQPFACGAASWKHWQLTGGGGPAWAVDKTPAEPAAQIADCTLNFNDGKGYACGGGAKKVGGTATSPWLDATGVKGNHLRARFRYSGKWHAKHKLLVQTSLDGQSWQTRYAASGYSTTAWSPRTLSLAGLKGKKFKLRFSFQTTGCADNQGSGPLIDQVRVWDATCYSDAQCQGDNLCLLAACNYGSCTLASKVCKDGDPCTVDKCAPATGKCSHPPQYDGYACNDGAGCTGPDKCQGGKCWGPPLQCDDGLVCTADTCDPKKGCVHAAVCADGKACTLDVCDGKTAKCAFTPMPEGSPCADGDACTGQERCDKGQCAGKPVYVGLLGNASIAGPAGIVSLPSGEVFVLSSTGHRLLRLDAKGVPLPFAGTGKAGFADGVGSKALFWGPRGLAAAPDGTLFVADTGNHRLRRVATSGAVATVAGSGKAGFADGAGDKARFSSPQGVAVDPQGILWVADTNNNRIRRVTPGGAVSTVAGKYGGFADGVGDKARLNRPVGIAVGPGGVLFVADQHNHRIRRVTPKGEVSTLAGSGKAGFADGFWAAARFNSPVGLLHAGGGWWWVADHHGARVRKVGPDGQVSTVAGVGLMGTTHGPPGIARLYRPFDLALAADGALLISDLSAGRIRRVAPPSSPMCVDGDKCTADGCDPKTGKCSLAPAVTCDDKDPCTVDACDPQTGKCKHGPKSCDDGDSCTLDTCDPKTGACGHAPASGCHAVTKKGYAQAFHCGAPSTKSWTLVSEAPGAVDKGAGPAWAVDATPAKPGYSSAACSLNFNDGQSYACPKGAKSVSGTATTPWLDATKIPAGGDLRLRLRYAGRWETSDDDELHVLLSGDDKSWTKVADLSATSTTYWSTLNIGIPAWAGKKFKLRLKFFTADCEDNAWTGPFVDDLRIWDATCAKPADCDDGNACTVEHCAAGKCSVTALWCDDGDPCTNDTCKSALGCAHGYKGDGAWCSDSDTCTDKDACAAGECTGVVVGADGQACSDGKPCTAGDTCKGGKCQAKLHCDDGNACTVDACDPKTGGCVWTAITCGGGPPCKSAACDLKTGKCVSGPSTCDDGDACTADTCDPKTGGCSHALLASCGGARKVPWAQAFGCGDPAGAGWTMSKGPGPVWAIDALPALPKPRSPGCTLNANDGSSYACAPGQKAVQADAVSPWIDASDVPKYDSTLQLRFYLSGKLYGLDATGKYDGDALEVAASKDGVKWQKLYSTTNNSTVSWGLRTVGLGAFAGGKLKLRFRLQTKGCGANAGSGPFIDDLSVRDLRCWADADCDDGKGCTVDRCQSYACTHAALDCQDDDPCTGDGCDAATGGCVHPPRPDGFVCKSAPGCTTWRCEAGACVGVQSGDGQGCSDGDSCTTGDKCKGGVCAGVASGAEGTPCQDADRCTTLDACKGGKCQGVLGLVATEDTAPLTWSWPYGLAIDAKGRLLATSYGHHAVRRREGGKFKAYAGSGAGFVDGPKDKAKFKFPTGLEADPSGNVWVADRGNNAIRRISAAGIVTTVAGGTKGEADGKGKAASFNQPWDVTVDKKGVLWVADTFNHRLRKIAPGGVVTTFAGGVAGFANGKGKAARFNRPAGVAVDALGVLYVCDQGNHRVRRVTPDGAVGTLAGGAYGWKDGAGAAARFASPQGIHFGLDGFLYVADRYNHDLRRLDAAGRVFTLTGHQGAGLVDGALSGARFSSPGDVLVDAKGVLWVADSGNGRIRRVTLGVAAAPCDDGAPCTKDACDPKTGVCDNGPELCDDGSPCTLDACDPKTGKCATSPYGCDDGDGCTADTCDPKLGCGHVAAPGCVTCAVAVDCDDGDACTDDTCAAAKTCEHVQVSGCAGCSKAADCDDGGPCTVDTCDAKTGKCGHTPGPTGLPCDDGSACTAADQCAGGQCEGVTAVVQTVAGTSKAGSGDGPGPAASFKAPGGVVRTPKGELIVADTGNHRIRRVTPWGVVQRVAGLLPGFGDGPAMASSTRFSSPADVAVGADGALYIADMGNHRVRRFALGFDQQVTTWAGSGVAGHADGAAKIAQLNAPGGIAADGSGRLYVADTGGHRLRVIQPDGKVGTLAGSGVASVKDGVGLAAGFKAPRGLALDGKGAIYVADSGGGALRRVSLLDGSTTTIAGPGKGVGEAMQAPWDVALGPGGWIYVADHGLAGILRVSAAGHRAVLSASAQGGDGDGPAWEASWSGPSSLLLLPDGRLLTAESGGHRLRQLVTVASICHDGAACTADFCDPKTGTCAIGPAQNETCDDGDPCTADWCIVAAGTCAHAPAKGCPAAP